MVIRKKGYLCGKCFKIYKTQKEALKCETDCLNNNKANKIYDLFLNYYHFSDGEKGVTGIRAVRNQLRLILNQAETILNVDHTEKDEY